MSLYMAEAELLAELELAVWLVVVLVHVLQEVRSQGQWEWMRKIGVDHNTFTLTQPDTRLPCCHAYLPTKIPTPPFVFVS